MARASLEKSAVEAKYNIRVLDRAFTVLKLLSDGKPRTALEVSKGINLNLSTTFRLLSTMCFYDYVRRDEFDQYSLGLACLELARGYQSSNNLRRVALIEMELLRDDLKETVHLAVLNKMEVVYIEKLPGLHPVGLLGSQIGGRSPAYCTGVGKSLLAYLDPEQVRAFYLTHGLAGYTPNTITEIGELMKELERVRAVGYSIDDKEHENEVCCVAAPIFNMDNQCVAAISVSGPMIRMDPVKENHEVIKKVKMTAFNISKQLGFHPST